MFESFRPSPANTEIVQEVADAVVQEFRVSTERKVLYCLNHRQVHEGQDASIYELNVGGTIELDWTWEGAIACRDDLESDSQGHCWRGEVVGVDETGGRLYVALEDGEPQNRPTTGRFVVRPFEFLRLLNDVYRSPDYAALRQRLEGPLIAAEGCWDQKIQQLDANGLPGLEEMWAYEWSVLWGPPGTGKTYTIGRQVAELLTRSPGEERILVLSTTNRATDGVAIEIGRGLQQRGYSAETHGQVLRLGRGVDLRRFRENDLTFLVEGTETWLLDRVSHLREEIRQTTDPEQQAILQQQLQQTLKALRDSSGQVLTNKNVSTVVTTVFKGSQFLADPEIRALIAQGTPPFTTVIVDEAGLISRAAVVVVSLLASRRVLLAGDPKQLAPISRMSRILPTNQARWLGSSGLSHLVSTEQAVGPVHLLTEQRRMHPQINRLVSAYQYDNKLVTASAVHQRPHESPAILADQPRAIWYVLDEEVANRSHTRASRGPGNRSWVRDATQTVLERLFEDGSLGSCSGLFLSPFRAQAQVVARLFSQWELGSWTASTVHSQQGAEADVVIFDTVNGSSTSWPTPEWRRLINVGLSRAREHVILLSTRSEMRSPFLRTLVPDLSPQVLKRKGKRLFWEIVPRGENERRYDPIQLGHQFAERRAMASVLSAEQQRLCGYQMDGKPRLVRGVAGSGKTAVLAHWVVQTVQRLGTNSGAKIWVLYANLSLHTLLENLLRSIWEDECPTEPFPEHMIELLWARNLINELSESAKAGRMGGNDFDLNAAAERYTAWCKKRGIPIAPSCQALFVDEAQDYGPKMLGLLNRLVEQTDPEDEKSRAVHIFYDNAQNLYGRPMPVWKDIGLDIQGRSFVMKESFRSTKPITEFAMNVLYRLLPAALNSDDHRELRRRGLVEETTRCGTSWWNIHFTHLDGPVPTFEQYKYENRRGLYETLGKQLADWIDAESVCPSDIVLLLIDGMNQFVENALRNWTQPFLDRLNVQICVERSQAIVRDNRTILATSPHSFKGYDAEIVVIPNVERFIYCSENSARTLYVAMTRARSILALYGLSPSRDWNREDEKRQQLVLLQTLDDCLKAMRVAPSESTIQKQDALADILEILGEEYRDWLLEISKLARLERDPLWTDDGVLIAEPLFWYRLDGSRWACFGTSELPQELTYRLKDEGIQIASPT